MVDTAQKDFYYPGMGLPPKCPPHCEHGHRYVSRGDTSDYSLEKIVCIPMREMEEGDELENK